MASAMKLGFIGLGSLGTPIAENLLATGHELYVYNRTASRAVPLEKKGAQVCDSVASLATQADIVFSIVSDDAALKSIVLGDAGLVANAKKGQTHISMSTILPATALELAEHYNANAQQYLAAPVFGRPESARVRKLIFALSGPEKLRKDMESVLKDAGAAGIYEFGETITAANTVKLCGNFMIAAAIEAMGESIGLAKKSGVDPQDMWNMFTQTIFSAPIYANYGNIILQDKFHPAAFTARLGLKDLNLVRAQADAANNHMPLADLLKSHLQELVDRGDDEQDWSALFKGAKRH